MIEGFYRALTIIIVLIGLIVLAIGFFANLLVAEIVGVLFIIVSFISFFISKKASKIRI